MLAKKTSKNQITIPKKVLELIPPAEYFDVSVVDGNVLLRPVQIRHTDLAGIRSKMERLGLDASSVSDAVNWARNK